MVRKSHIRRTGALGALLLSALLGAGAAPAASQSIQPPTLSFPSGSGAWGCAFNGTCPPSEPVTKDRS